LRPIATNRPSSLGSVVSHQPGRQKCTRAHQLRLTGVGRPRPRVLMRSGRVAGPPADPRRPTVPTSLRGVSGSRASMAARRLRMCAATTSRCVRRMVRRRGAHHGPIFSVPMAGAFAITAIRHRRRTAQPLCSAGIGQRRTGCECAGKEQRQNELLPKMHDGSPSSVNDAVRERGGSASVPPVWTPGRTHCCDRP
jgi:hypothetical protein